MMNLFALEEVNLNLKAVKLNGIKGWNRIIEELQNAWWPTTLEMPPILTSISGIKTISNITSGMADFILLPLEQYQKDGRFIKGIQRGARSIKTSASEAFKVGHRIAKKTRSLLEKVDSNNTLIQDENPENITQGLRLAYKSFAENIESANKIIFALPSNNSSNPTLAQAVPIAIVRPLIGATNAISLTLSGISNSLKK